MAAEEQLQGFTVALECKARWADLILQGTKSVECRGYPPPEALRGQKCLLIASEGPEGQATFGDSIEPGGAGGSIVGWVLFDDAATEYSTPEAFAADRGLHCVPPDSPYAPRPGGPPVYGWRVVASCRFAQPCPLPAMTRVFRSVYRLA